MKLIDYVIENDKNIDGIKGHADRHEIELKDYILTNYCPSAFKVLANTPYIKPYVAYKYDKRLCKYGFEENNKKCNECWNRKVLVAK